MEKSKKIFSHVCQFTCGLVVGLILMIILFGDVSVSYGSDAFDLLKKKCEVQWGNDYEMQGYCIDMQVKAASNIRSKYGKILDSAKSTEFKSVNELPIQQKIVFLCYNQWMHEGIDFDYTMWEYCIDNQFQAARRLGKIK